MKRAILILAVLAWAETTSATDYYAISNGTWSNAGIWSLTSTGSGPAGPPATSGTFYLQNHSVVLNGQDLQNCTVSGGTLTTGAAVGAYFTAVTLSSCYLSVSDNQAILQATGNSTIASGSKIYLSGGGAYYRMYSTGNLIVASGGTLTANPGFMKLTDSTTATITVQAGGYADLTYLETVGALPWRFSFAPSSNVSVGGQTVTPTVDPGSTNVKSGTTYSVLGVSKTGSLYIRRKDQ